MQLSTTILLLLRLEHWSGRSLYYMHWRRLCMALHVLFMRNRVCRHFRLFRWFIRNPTATSHIERHGGLLAYKKWPLLFNRIDSRLFNSELFVKIDFFSTTCPCPNPFILCSPSTHVIEPIPSVYAYSTLGLLWENIYSFMESWSKKRGKE